MRVPLTDKLRREAEHFQLRSSCRDCAFFVQASEACAHGWPNEEQRQWPVAPAAAEWPFCKEFELA